MSCEITKPYPPAPTHAAKYHPANFAELGWVGSDVMRLCDIDSALNEGIATGKKLMGETLKKLARKSVEIPDHLQHRWWIKENHSGRYRPHPLVVTHPTKNGAYILVAGSDLLYAADEAGLTHLDCVVIPHQNALDIGQLWLKRYGAMPNGQPAFAATTPSPDYLKQSYVSKDTSEGNLDKLTNTEEPTKGKESRKKPPRIVRPAVSLSGVTQGLDPRASLYLPLTVHATTVEDGHVVVRANNADQSATAPETLFPEEPIGLDIQIVSIPRKAGRPGLSLHEFALTHLLLRLFDHVEKEALIDDQRRSGHSIAEDKRLKDKGSNGHWPGSPRSFQNWVDTRQWLLTCSNEFWNKGIPDTLFNSCASLNFGCETPTSAQREAFLFHLIKAAFKALDLANRQTSNIRKLHKALYTGNPRPLKRGTINQTVDGVPNPSIGESHQVDEVVRFMLAVLGRTNPAKIWRDKAYQTLMYQWLVAIGDWARTGKMIVSLLMAQEFILVDRERRMGRSIDAGWMVFDAILASSLDAGDKFEHAYSHLAGLCDGAMAGSYAMIVSRQQISSAMFDAEPLEGKRAFEVETPILLF